MPFVVHPKRRFRVLSHRRSARRHALLLTGPPRVGKTTVFQKVLTALGDRSMRGFLTEEIRENGERVGFRIETLDGQSAILAHVDSSSTSRVGRYRVEIAALERVVELALEPPDSTTLFVIDEIGKMECFSGRFVETVTALLDSGCPVLATVAREGGGFIEQVKKRPDVELWEVTRKNRDHVPARILSWLESEVCLEAHPAEYGSPQENGRTSIPPLDDDP